MNNAKLGVLLLNLGGPETVRDVKPFLYNLFSDADILVGVPSPLRQSLAWTIAALKGPSSARAYEAIGGGSPQLKWTRIQAGGLERRLNQQQVPVKVAIGMRAWKPFIQEGLEELREWGAERLLVLPLFPQYSTTTTGSCFKEIPRCLARMGWNPPTSWVERWPDHTAYVELLRSTLNEAVERADWERRRDGCGGETIHILFSAHSLPMKIIERGDPYLSDVKRTLAGVSSGLKHPFSLAFQSRNGRMPWLEPYTEDELVRLGSAGVKRLVVVPISFVSDHIETSWELDILYAKIARENGIVRYYRSRSFNDDPIFVDVLSSLVRESGAWV